MRINISTESINLLGNRYSNIKGIKKLSTYVMRYVLSVDGKFLKSIDYIYSDYTNVIEWRFGHNYILDYINNFDVKAIFSEIQKTLVYNNIIKLNLNNFNIEDMTNTLSKIDYSKLKNIDTYTFIGIGGFNSHVLSNIALLISLNETLINSIFSLLTLLSLIKNKKYDNIIENDILTEIDFMKAKFIDKYNNINYDLIKDDIKKLISALDKDDKEYCRLFILDNVADNIPKLTNDINKIDCELENYIDNYIDIVSKYDEEIRRFKGNVIKNKIFKIYEDDKVEFSNIVRFPYYEDSFINKGLYKINKLRYFYRLLNYLSDNGAIIKIHTERFKIENNIEDNDSTLYIGAISPSFRLQLLKKYKNRFIFCGHHNNEYEISNEYSKYENLNEDELFINESYGNINIPVLFTNLFDATIELIKIMSNYDQENNVNKHFLDIIMDKHLKKDISFFEITDKDSENNTVRIDELTEDELTKDKIDNITLGYDRQKSMLIVDKELTPANNNITDILSNIEDITNNNNRVNIVNKICTILL